jgi:hypothetical protein
MMLGLYELKCVVLATVRVRPRPTETLHALLGWPRWYATIALQSLVCDGRVEIRGHLVRAKEQPKAARSSR